MEHQFVRATCHQLRLRLRRVESGKVAVVLDWSFLHRRKTESEENDGRQVQSNFGELISCAEAIARDAFERARKYNPLSRVTRVVTSNATSAASQETSMKTSNNVIVAVTTSRAPTCLATSLPCLRRAHK